MTQDNKQNEHKEENKKPQDQSGVMMEGHIKIFDPDSGDVYVDKKNAIHYENFSVALAKSIISKSSVCYDLSYNSSPTKFMLWAMKNGADSAIQGWGMLIEQAAESYRIWKKIRPDTSAILKQLNVTSSSQILRR